MGAKFQCTALEGGKNVVRGCRGGGQIVSAQDFRISTAPPPVNNDRSLMEHISLKLKN